jgi:gas vesicle protein
MPDRIYYSEEARRLMERRQLTGVLAAFSLGLIIGSALALLFAPQEGEKTRQIMRDTLEEGFERGRRATDDALSQLEDEIPNLRAKVEETVKRARS